MATIPKATVEIAFDGGPFSPSYTWTDVGDFVRGFQVKRGRNNELDRIEAGTLSLTLDNSDGRFSPGKREFGPNVLAAFTEETYAVNVSDSEDSRTLQGWNHSVNAGTRYVWSARVRTNTASASLFWAVDWRDSAGTQLRYVVGTQFLADTVEGVYTHEETAPSGAVSANVWLWVSSYPNGNAGVITISGVTGFECAPYWPNVLPRRRVRIRTANLTPKDISTGGDVSRSNLDFYANDSNAAWTYDTSVSKSGGGSMRFEMVANGTADWASSLYCGFTAGGTSRGLTRVEGGKVYSTGTQLRLAEASPDVRMKTRIRWFDSNLALLGSSAGGPSAVLSASSRGTWIQARVLNQTAPANAVWAAVELGSSGGDNEAVVFIDEIQLEQSATLSEWHPGGSIFQGYIEKWPVSSDGLTAEVAVTAVDGFSILSDTDLRAAMQAQILGSDPLGYWPLGDSEGATRIENLAEDQQPAQLVASKYGAGTALLGAPSIVRNDETTCYSLANVGARIGTVVDICESGARTYVLGSAFSAAFWTSPVRPSSGQYVTLFAAWSDNAQEFLSVRLDSSGRLEVRTTYADGIRTTFTPTNTLSTSEPSFVAVTVGTGHTSLYVNGVTWGGSTKTGFESGSIRNLRWASFGGRQAGSIYSEYSNGRHAHLAVWGRAITLSEIGDIWSLGDNHGLDFFESEATRLRRIATMAHYQGETAIDAGLSMLQRPSWSTGAKALDVFQAAAEDASGYVFMDGDGRLTYHNRRRRQSADARYRLGDSLGLPYEPGLSFEMDEDRIINEVSWKRVNGSEGVLKDAASVAAYGRKSGSVELAVTTDAAVQDAAYSLLYAYSEPLVRCDSVTLKATATPELYGVVLGIEVGDRITLHDQPSQAPTSEADYYVEAIDTNVVADGGTLDWVTVLSLSPAANSDVWILEDPVLGRLDQSAVLAY